MYALFKSCHWECDYHHKIIKLNNAGKNDSKFWTRNGTIMTSLNKEGGIFGHIMTLSIKSVG